VRELFAEGTEQVVIGTSETLKAIDILAERLRTQA